MVKVTFEPMTAAEEHTIRLTQREYNPRGKSRIVPLFEGVPMAIVLKKGDVYEFDKEVFEALVDAGQVRTKAQMKAKAQLIADKKPIYEMPDEEKFLMLTDLPYEV